MDDTREDQSLRDQVGGVVPDGHGNTATFKTYSSVTCQDETCQEEISLDATCLNLRVMGEQSETLGACLTKKAMEVLIVVEKYKAMEDGESTTGCIFLRLENYLAA